VNNSGLLIGGGLGAVLLGLGNDEMVNTGTVIGDIDMGDDADLFDGRGGVVDGDVLGGTGDDECAVQCKLCPSRTHPGTTNWGRNARKKKATFGFNNDTSTPCLITFKPEGLISTLSLMNFPPLEPRADNPR